MSLCMYKTKSSYYYAVEIGMPEHTVTFGEGETPAEAVRSMEPTQYQSAYFGCRGPANSKLGEFFDLGHDDAIVDCTEEEEAEAEEAYQAGDDSE